jgi:dTDP-glucose 4,6-dehydratase
VYSYIKTYGIPAVIVRPFNQFGPRQHLEKLIPRFITSALKGEPLTVHGEGTASRDWMYVEDTCVRLEKTILAPLSTVRGEALNLGSGYAADINTIANLILEYTGRPKSLIRYVGDRPGQVDRHISSTDKAQRLIAPPPPRSFEEGLKQTIDWYKENKEWWKRIEWMQTVPVRTVSGKIEYH